MSDQTNLTETLRSIADAMRERNLRWYLFGAQAAIIWGSPRWSADVDITAEIEPSAIDPFVATMKQHGFDLLVDDSEFVARTRVLPLIHKKTQMPLDVVLAGSGLEQDFMTRAIPTDVDGTSVPVISPEDLIIAKVLAGRAKDIEDIRHLIHQRRSSLDAERIRGVLGLLEQALSQSDLLPVFESEWRRS